MGARLPPDISEGGCDRAALAALAALAAALAGPEARLGSCGVRTLDGALAPGAATAAAAAAFVRLSPRLGRATGPSCRQRP